MVDQQVLGPPDPPSRGCQETRVQEQGGYLPRRVGPPLVLADPYGSRVNALPSVDGDLLRYVENWSLMLDVQILWKTISAVLAKRGAR